MNSKNILKLFLIILILFTLILSGLSCSGDDTSPAGGYYTCSMHPQVIQQEPGRCPICGMNLTYVEGKDGGKEHDHGKVKYETEINLNKDHKIDENNRVNFQFSLARTLIQNAKVYTVPVKKESFTRKETYSGHIDYNEDPNRLVIINTKYDGWIERLYVSKEGQQIRRGSRLMGVYSPAIISAKEEYITTYSMLKDLYIAQNKSLDELPKDSTLAAVRRKLLNLDVASSQIKQLEKTLNAGRLTFYHSPISGVIIQKKVLQGSHIKAGQELFRIANLSSLWVFIHIFEKDLSFVKKGQRVSIKTGAYPDKVYKGRIDLIYPFFDMKTKDVKVRIIVPNRKGNLRPGMYVNVDVESKLRDNTLTIPEMAIIFSGEKNYVFVSLGKGKFEVRPVSVVTRSEGKAVITKGLAEKELVVANGQFLLSSEASLKEAIEKGKISGSHQH